jgi:hypothetical protein
MPHKVTFRNMTEASATSAAADSQSLTCFPLLKKIPADDEIEYWLARSNIIHPVYSYRDGPEPILVS